MKKECMVCRKIYVDEYKIIHEGMHFDSSNMFCDECLEKGYDKDYKIWQKKFDEEKLNRTAYQPLTGESLNKRSQENTEYYIRVLAKKKQEDKKPETKEQKEEKVKKLKEEVKKEKKNKKDIIKKMVQKYCDYYLSKIGMDEDKLVNYIYANLNDKNLQLCDNHMGMRSIISDLTQEFIVKENFRTPLETNLECRIQDTGIRRLQ